MSAADDALRALACLDFTRLDERDEEQDIKAFLQQLSADKPLPAAICIYPQWLTYVRAYMQMHFSQPPALATVTNFPHGDQPLDVVLRETELALALGADEIDLVLPYKRLQAGDEQTPLDYVRRSKELCAGRARLKVIIESGELSLPQVAQATRIAIAGGADFVKTSTGKVVVNATYEAVAVMLTEIKQSGQDVGLKVSGGVRTLAQAQQYMALADKVMGESWLTPAHFRFGASALLEDLYRAL
ncbi:deoxyribose-phosphate aldolase [Pseudoalteromonas sp. T1lg10]|uniref:deoxyribose-phosphate aldolase n=1 Tax=Pseudoalteromonas sp. T1lg10 TaxID=2077093 RepID=UPI000CF6313B|nr:deoxyribose-phosphate aldolase [Pseudoalteromonas sp. T1lg10]